MKNIYIFILLIFLNFSAFSQTGMLNGTGYAPNFTVTDINGTSHTLYNYLDSGYVMVLELLSVTCGHCIAYAPGTENSYQTNGPNGTNVARFLGLEVNSSTDSTAIANFMTNYGVTMPIADNVSPVGINYQLYYTPSYFVVYPDRSYTTMCPMYCVTTSTYLSIENQLNTAIAAWTPPVSGCMDSLAFNYDPLATVDDSSCYYCNPSDTVPTNLSTNWVTNTKAQVLWDNMNDSCNMVWKYYLRYREVNQNPPFGSSLDFDGTSDHVVIPNDSLYNFTNSFTIQARFNADTWLNNGGNHEALVSNFGGSGLTIGGFELAIENNFSSNGLKFSLCSNTGCHDLQYYPLTSYNTGQWYDFVVTYDNGVLKMYLDGNFVKSRNITGTLNSSTYDLVFGTRADQVGLSGTNVEFDGKIDEVNIWNTALNPSQISELHSCSPLTNSPGLIGKWDLNEGSGNTAFDLVNSNNGTINGANYTTDVITPFCGAWTTKSAGVGNGLCNFGLNTTTKTLQNLIPATTYEYKMKAFYCGGTESNYSVPVQFTTKPDCPPMTNLTATTFNGNQAKVRFDWDSTGAYVFARVALRVDTSGANWQTAGGFGVYYPTLQVNKFGLQPGESYRAQGRTFCDSNITSYRSWWTSPIFWTQPGSIRLNGGTTINHFDVYPNPTNDIFNVSFVSEEIQSISIRVLNIVGEVIYEESLDQFVGEYTKQISIGDYSKGIYLFEVVNDVNIEIRKVILD